MSYNYACDICDGIAFPTINELRRHKCGHRHEIVIDAKKNEDNIYVCETCPGVTFSTINELRRHKCGHRKVQKYDERQDAAEYIHRAEDNYFAEDIDNRETTDYDIHSDDFKLGDVSASASANHLHFEEYQDYSWVDHDSTKFDESEYINFQRNMYESTVGEACLEACNIDNFVTSIKGDKYVSQNQKNHEFFQLVDSMNISDERSQQVLDFIHSCKPGKYINESWKSIRRREESKYAFMKYKTHSFSFPKHWNMEVYQGKIHSLHIKYIDPLQQLAEKFIDPEIMFSCKEDIYFKARMIFEESEASRRRVIGPVMTADWAIETQNLLYQRLGNEDGILVPIIIYEDGVSVGHFNQVTETPCLGTLGNFSVNLMKKNVSKLQFGFLPDLASYLNIPELVLHLRNQGYSKSKTKDEIKYFGMELRRLFWKLIFFSITKCWKQGISIYALGLGISKIHTCICFCNGDDPALRQLATIYLTSCISCSFTSRNREKYDPEKHQLRNVTEIANLCTIAQEGYSKKRGLLRANLSHEEMTSIRKLHERKIHPIVNIMNHVPMGSRNHIYIGTQDNLHAVIGGPVKSTLTWCQRCINAIANSLDDEFSRANAIYDQRIATFPSVPCCPHVEWTTFTSGLSHMSDSETTKEKESSGGNGGGYRTSFLVTALIQTYFAIGSYGDILPNKRIYTFTVLAKSKKTSRKEKISFNVANPTSICMTAIKDVLDFYFNVKRNEVPEEDIENVVMASYSKMYSSMMLLWKLKEALILSYGKEYPDSRKLHDLAHLSYRYKRYGSPTNSDCSPFECFHKEGTVRNWRQTSGIQKFRHEEMLHFILKTSFESFSEKCRLLFNYGSNVFKQQIVRGLKTITNTKSYKIKFDDNFMIANVLENAHLFNNFPIALEDYVDSLQKSDFTDIFISDSKNIQLVQKVSVCDEYWGKDIYRVGEFVTVQLVDHDGCIREGVAKTLAITEVYDEEEADFYFTVQHLVSVIPPPVNNKRKLSNDTILKFDTKNEYDIFQLLTFERNQSDSIQTLHHLSINGPAFVIPCFRIPDRYRFVNKKYFDRSGWMSLMPNDHDTSDDQVESIEEEEQQPPPTTQPRNNVITEFFNVVAVPSRSSRAHATADHDDIDDLFVNEVDDENDEQD